MVEVVVAQVMVNVAGVQELVTVVVGAVVSDVGSGTAVEILLSDDC